MWKLSITLPYSNTRTFFSFTIIFFETSKVPDLMAGTFEVYMQIEPVFLNLFVSLMFIHYVWSLKCVSRNWVEINEIEVEIEISTLIGATRPAGQICND